MLNPIRIALGLSFLSLLGACTVKADAADAAAPAAADAGTSEDSGGDTAITTDGMNGCKTTGYLDETAGTANDRMIMIAGGKFDYPCMTIKAGQSVMLMWNFATYPLAPGLAPDHANDPAGTDPTPIMMHSTGSLATPAFPTAGMYPFYVTGHAGMSGVIQVQ